MLSYIASFFKPTSVSSLPLSVPSELYPHPPPSVSKKYSQVFIKGLPIKDEHKPGVKTRYKMF